MAGIGKKFKDVREKRGLTYDQVSEQTKIRQHIIVSIEEDDYTFMPPIYIKAFIKSYGKFLKFSNDELEQYIGEIFPADTIQQLAQESAEEYNQQREEQKEDYTEIFKSKKKTIFTANSIVSYLIYAALALALGGLVYFTFFAKNTKTGSPIDNQDKADTVQIGKDGTSSDSTNTFVLVGKAVDTVWVRINIDDKSSEQIVMTPGQEKTWAAVNYIILSMDNCKAIHFQRNGQSLPDFGRYGSVIRNIKITRNDVISSSTPYTNPPDTVGRRKRKAIPKKVAPATTVQEPVLLKPSAAPPVTNPFDKKDKKDKDKKEKLP